MINRIVGMRARACAPFAAVLVPALAALLAGCGAYNSTASTDGASSAAGARSTANVPDPPAQEAPAAQESNLPEIVVTARAPRADGQSIPSYIGKREREAMARKARAANGSSNETG
jgi:hypothetical protein